MTQNTVLEEINEGRSIHTYNRQLKGYITLVKDLSSISEKDKHKIRYSGKITKNNQQLIEQYAKDYKASAPTVLKNVQCLSVLARVYKKNFSFEEKDINDLNKLYDWIVKNQEWEPATKNKFIGVMLRFSRWVWNNNPQNKLKLRKGTYPQTMFKWENIPERNGHGRTEKGKKKLEEMKNPYKRYTLQDYKKIIIAASNPRDRAICAKLAESGARIGEIGSQNVEDIRDEALIDRKKPWMSNYFPRGKTGSNYLPLFNSKPFDIAWLAEHPNPKEGQPLYVNRYGKRLSYNRIKRIWERAVTRTKINKPTGLHHARRSTADILKKYFKDSKVMDAWFNWSSGKMQQHYTTHSPEDLWENYKEFLESEENVLQPKECPKCNRLASGIEFNCANCLQPIKRVCVSTKFESLGEKNELIETNKTLEGRVQGLESKLGEVLNAIELERKERTKAVVSTKVSR